RHCCPSLDSLFPDGATLATHDANAYQRALDALQYMDAGHAFSLMPGARYMLARNKRRHLKEAGAQTNDPVARAMGLAGTNVAHEDYRAAISHVDDLVRDHPDEGFVRLWAAEFYANVMRRAQESDHSTYADIAKVSMPVCRERQVEHLQRGLALRLLKNPQVNPVAGFKNKVFFIEDPYLNNIVVLKIGADRLRDEYANLEYLHRVQPFGMVPFPVALLSSKEANLPFVGPDEQLLIARRLPGTPLAECDPAEHAQELGYALATFQARGSHALHRVKNTVRPYSYDDFLHRKVAPRLQRHLGVVVDDTLAAVVDERHWGEHGLVHGDMTGFNGMYVAHPTLGRRVSFLDVESLRHAPFVADVGSYLAHFSCMMNDPSAFVDEYRDNHDVRTSRDGLYDAVWRSSVFHWMSQLSTALEWCASGKLSSEQKGPRLKAYEKRLHALTRHAPFAAIADGYAGSLGALREMEERLSRV
ncbi:MAG: hypothetical protein AABY13_00620, partial [Nanoarchaeota archaeon]